MLPRPLTRQILPSDRILNVRIIIYMNSLPEGCSPADNACYGCSKCRYITTGCTQCRRPGYKPRSSSTREELRNVARAARIANGVKRQHIFSSGGDPSPVPRKYRKVEEKSPIPPPSKKRTIDGDTHQVCKYYKVTPQSLTDVEMREVGQEEQPPSTSQKRPFLEALQNSIQERRIRRLSGDNMASEILLQSASKRRKLSTVERPDEDPKRVLWQPPVSPFGLLEESLYEDPWRLLVACVLLNKTTATQVRKVIWDFFKCCPTPETACAADPAGIETLIHPLGLHRKRALSLQRMSHDYLHKNWCTPEELHACGKYAADAYFIFCRGRWKDVHPEDKDLRLYRNWLAMTDGLGTGLTRHD